MCRSSLRRQQNNVVTIKNVRWNPNKRKKMNVKIKLEKLFTRFSLLPVSERVTHVKTNRSLKTHRT